MREQLLLHALDASLGHGKKFSKGPSGSQPSGQGWSGESSDQKLHGPKVSGPRSLRVPECPPIFRPAVSRICAGMNGFISIPGLRLLKGNLSSLTALWICPWMLMA